MTVSDSPQGRFGITQSEQYAHVRIESIITMAKKLQFPNLVTRKIYKTCQTRGADDDVIYQNRVKRNSTVLIPLDVWDRWEYIRKEPFESGYIVIISPAEAAEISNRSDLEIGRNTLVFYQTRAEWKQYPPEQYGWVPATSRPTQESQNLGGHFVARVPGTTASGEAEKAIRLGYSTKELKGAGIRFYEYANEETIEHTKEQLQYLFYCCYDVEDFLQACGNDKSSLKSEIAKFKQYIKAKGLGDDELLKKNRILDSDGHLVCPFCLEKISATNFAKIMGQAEGRNVPDMTVTEVNLFHIEELKAERFNHRPYNLGWGHHHCNVVVKDSGIEPTLAWISSVLKRNVQLGLWHE